MLTVHPGILSNDAEEFDFAGELLFEFGPICVLIPLHGRGFIFPAYPPIQNLSKLTFELVTYRIVSCCKSSATRSRRTLGKAVATKSLKLKKIEILADLILCVRTYLLLLLLQGRCYLHVARK
jgi:hypothetical protein